MVTIDLSSIWIYFLIPVISALVGYLTNALAIWMTFEPTEFGPIRVWQPEGQPWGLFGWQGIIPAKAVTMTKLFCRVFVDKVLNVDALFSRIDAHHVADLTRERMQEATSRIVDEVAGDIYPKVWGALPPKAKAEVTNLVIGDSHLFVELMLQELQHKVLVVLDTEALVAKVVQGDKRLLSDIFQTVGRSEFVFIRRSGFYFGFLFGLLQSAVYVFYKAGWVLPVAGFFVGFATNWLALKLIFEPAKPIAIGPWHIQGLFLKRQKEASAEMARVSKSVFLKQELIWKEVMEGEKQQEWRDLLTRVTHRFLKQQAQASLTRKLAVALLVGEQRLTRIQEQVSGRIVDAVPEVLPVTYDYMDETMDVETAMREALQAMPPAEFIGILRPVFKQDELKLIVVGGVLGAAAGCLQHFGVFQFIH